MAEAFDAEFRNHQDREAELDRMEDERRADEVARQIDILEPFWLWLANEIPNALIGSKIFHDYENAFFDFGDYYVGVKGDECVTVDSDHGIVEWIYQKFLDQQ